MRNIKRLILYASVICLFLGIVAGAVYMANSGGDSELYEYLSRYFESFSAEGRRFEIFKNSLSDNIKFILVITFCAFFRLGVAGTLGCCVFKGFTSGFTTAAFVKYYGIRGLLVPLSSLLSTVIYLPVFVIFCTYSASFSLSRDKKNMLGKFLLFVLMCFTVFSVISFFDGYVTTTFIKLLKPFVCKAGG